MEFIFECSNRYLMSKPRERENDHVSKIERVTCRQVIGDIKHLKNSRSFLCTDTILPVLEIPLKHLNLYNKGGAPLFSSQPVKKLSRNIDPEIGSR